MKIRRMRKIDVYPVSGLITKVIRHNFAKIYPKKVIQNFCEHNSAENIKKNMKKINYYVVEVKNKIIAVAGVKNNTIKSFHVDVNYQGKGIGKKLMKFLEELYIKKKMFKKINVHSSLSAVKFYRKCGFVKIKKELHTIEGGGKYYTVLMEKKIF